MPPIQPLSHVFEETLHDRGETDVSSANNR
jgi:hypothetical protein